VAVTTAIWHRFCLFLSIFWISFKAVPFSPSFHFDVNTDPAPHQNDMILRPLVYRPSMAQFLASTAPQFLL
jgi:hypothetical protein